MKTLHLVITSGERSCASSPGEFCHFLLSTNFGTRWRCQIFDSPDARERTGLKEVDGWIQRHPGCIAAESESSGSVDKPARPGCPKCGKQPQDFPLGGGPCCNPACNGTWGTGCYHCHHPRFLDDR